MTKAELKLAAYLLKEASEEFSNHGCNDLWLVKDAGLTEAESREIHETIEAYQPPDDRVEYSGHTDDWCAMYVMAAKLRSASDRCA